jgi:lipopolysaccharide transport system ATP-binding protein
MGSTVIQVERLGKMYRLRESSQGYGTLRDTLAARMFSPHKWFSGVRPSPRGFWALRDVSFEIQQGEVVGIIGRNGAGKSTLLKILSRIVEPTEGQARIRGRLGSLLEVGTGFHPELTGRENIFLNGAILGMKRADIRRKFDEIVAFAEVDRFLDTPVKHYSSGMFVRLAFSVAAHLEPDLLMVDEVLAVGDAQFQKKCLGKVDEISRHGRTVLFVSHDMLAIARLCKRVLYLDQGAVVMDGDSHSVTAAYLMSGKDGAATREWPDSHAPGGEVVRLRSVRVRDHHGRAAASFPISHPLSLEMEYDVLRSGYRLLPNFHLCGQEGVLAFITFDLDPDWQDRPRPSGRYTSSVEIPGHFLNEGLYSVHAGLETTNPFLPQFYEKDVVAFQIGDDMTPGAARGLYSRSIPGVVRPRLAWKTHPHALAGAASGEIPS